MNDDSIKLPLDIELDDKALASIAKRLVSVSKTFSSTLEKDITRVAFSLQQMGYANKGDVVAKIKSYLPPKTKLSSVAEYGLSAGAGRGVDESRRVIRTRRDMARQQAAEARAQAKEEERRIRWEKAAKSTYEKYQYAQEIKEAKQIQAVAAAETQAENIQKREEVKKAVEEEQKQKKVSLWNTVASLRNTGTHKTYEEYKDEARRMEGRFEALPRYRSIYGEGKYRKKFDELFTNVKSMNKNTNGSLKELQTLENTMTKVAPKGVSGIAGVAGKLIGPAAIAALVKGLGRFMVKQTVQGLKEGEDAFTQHAMYGSDYSTGLTKAIALGWGISESDASAPQRQALDFRQRLMWGELGDKEIIGLSRMGEYGRMVMSGEAKTNPMNAYRELVNWIQNTDEATARSALTQAGIPLSWMKAAQKVRTEDEFMEFYNAIQNATDLEEQASFATLRGRAAKDEFLERIRGLGASIAGGTEYLFDPTGKKLSEEWAASKGINYSVQSVGATAKNGTARAIESLWSGDMNNNITINVKSAREAGEVAQEVSTKMYKQSILKSINSLTNSQWE